MTKNEATDILTDREKIEKEVIFYIYSSGFTDGYSQKIDLKTGFEKFYQSLKEK